MLLQSAVFLALAALAQAAPQPLTTVTIPNTATATNNAQPVTKTGIVTAAAGAPCTQVIAPGTTQPIVDGQGVTLSCDRSSYAPVPTTTVIKTNLITQTVNATGNPSVVTQTMVSTFIPPEASASLAIASATSKLNAAMAKATAVDDKFIWRGALSIASDYTLSETANVGEEKSLRRRLSEVCEAQFYIKHDWTAIQNFMANNTGYKIETTNPEEWAKIVSGEDTSRAHSMKALRHEQDLYATVNLWPGSNPLLVNTTWKDADANSTNNNQLWKSAILSTLNLPQVKQRLKEYQLPENITQDTARDDQLLVLFGMVSGQRPVKRIFKDDAVHGISVALDAVAPFSNLMLVQTKDDADEEVLRKATTYVVTNVHSQCPGENGQQVECADEKDRTVTLGMHIGDPQVENNGFAAQVTIEQLEQNMAYMIHPETPSYSTQSCGWIGKGPSEDACYW